jgi:hypothetical protein
LTTTDRPEHRETATLSSKRDSDALERAVRLLRTTRCVICGHAAAEVRISRHNDMATISGFCAAHQLPDSTTAGRRIQVALAERAIAKENASA